MIPVCGDQAVLGVDFVLHRDDFRVGRQDKQDDLIVQSKDAGPLLLPLDEAVVFAVVDNCVARNSHSREVVSLDMPDKVAAKIPLVIATCNNQHGVTVFENGLMVIGHAKPLYG